MFLDKLSKTQLIFIAIINITFATIMLVLVIVLPLVLKTEKTNDFRQECSPTMENTELWAEFPGVLKSELSHSYQIFNYTKLNGASKSYQIDVIKNVSIKEEVKYNDFSENDQDDTIYLHANRNYSLIDEEKDYNNIKINSINMGLFEVLETMSYPPLYKVGINSIYYLLKRTLIDPDLFIRELFSYKTFNELTEEDKKEKIFSNIPSEIIDAIFSDDDKYKKYSFKSNAGFFEWIKILGKEEEISKANWLSELFNLNDAQIFTILGDDSSYLNSEYQKLYSQIANKFCKNSECGSELLYTQLIDGSVIKYLNLKVKNYLSLNKELGTNYYPFDTSPEMDIYFDEKYKTIISEKEPKFEDYSPSKEQLESLLNTNSVNCLLSPNNSIYLLYLNKTEEKNIEQKYYLQLTYNNINFLSEYFYNYLPKIFLYPKINNANHDTNFKEEEITIEPIAKTMSSMVQIVPKITYPYLSKINLYEYIFKKTLLYEVKKKTKSIELDEICPVIMQKVLDDGKKVFKICSDENITFNSEESLYKWVGPYYCLSDNKDDKKCNMYIINYLKELVYISDDEINQIFGEESLGGIISDTLEIIKNAYNCGDRCEEEGYLNKLQFWTGIITSNAPESLEKSDTIKSWFPDAFPYPVEISYYQKKYGKNYNFTEQDIDNLIGLIIDNGTLFDLENSNSFVNKLKLEKGLSLYMNNKESSSSLYTLTLFLIDVFIFKDELHSNGNSKQSLLVQYSSIGHLLQGNDEEDEYWINYLSSGNYFDNYKPKFTRTTGLDIGINLNSMKQENFEFDYYGISTNSDNLDKRRFNKMNDLLTLNIKKKEYDYIKDDYTDVISPTFNFEKLLGNRRYSDGFQYSHDLTYIYYYDIISSRPLEFQYSNEENYEGNKFCRKYKLVTDELSINLNEYYDLNNKNAMIAQKVNKPFMISTNFNYLNYFGYSYDLKNEDNYICVDPISDMVIDSKINLIYGMNTRKYQFVNEMIEEKEFYPLFIYHRNYKVELNSYEDQFPSVSKHRRDMVAFIIIGSIAIVLFVVIAIVLLCHLRKPIENNGKEEQKESLVSLPLTKSGLESNRDSEQKANEAKE